MEIVETECKVCTECFVEKSLSDFHNHKKGKFGKESKCKVCMNKKTRLYQVNNKQKIAAYTKKHREKYAEEYKIKARDTKYRLNYNMSIEEYDKLSNGQNGVCAVCSRPERDPRKFYLCVDHDHVTGKVRGLLCSKCNSGIGHLDDSIELLEEALKYLKNSKTNEL